MVSQEVQKHKTHRLEVDIDIERTQDRLSTERSHLCSKLPKSVKCKNQGKNSQKKTFKITKGPDITAWMLKDLSKETLTEFKDPGSSKTKRRTQANHATNQSMDYSTKN